MPHPRHALITVCLLACSVVPAALAQQDDSQQRRGQILEDLEQKQQLLHDELDVLRAKLEKMESLQQAIAKEIERADWELKAMDRLITELGSRVRASEEASAGQEAAIANPDVLTKARKANGLVSVRYVFEEATKARAARAALRERGIDSYIAEGGGSYRVYAGAYADAAIANEHARRFGPLEGVKPELFLPE